MDVDETTKDYLWYKMPFHNRSLSGGTSNGEGWVRGDVAAVKNALSDGDTVAFPDDIVTLMKFWGCKMPQASTQPGQVVAVYDYPDKTANTVSTIEGSGIGTGISQFSPLWYQLQITDTRRGWVRASQVTAHHMEGLRAVQPRLRRRADGTATVPVRSGPAADEAVLATIPDNNTAWHSLLGRDAAHPD